jgi:hypothetical protein
MLFGNTHDEDDDEKSHTCKLPPRCQPLKEWHLSVPVLFCFPAHWPHTSMAVGARWTGCLPFGLPVLTDSGSAWLTHRQWMNWLCQQTVRTALALEIVWPKDWLTEWLTDWLTTGIHWVTIALLPTLTRALCASLRQNLNVAENSICSIWQLNNCQFLLYVRCVHKRQLGIH